MMDETIKNFPKQFSYEPVVENGGLPGGFNTFVVVAMGGSALVADLLRERDSKHELIIHRGYGLPRVNENVLNRSALIAISYSGNTEETLDAFTKAHALGMSTAVIATGGKLIEFAKKNAVPFIQIPNTGIQPRHANGFILKALMKLIRNEAGLAEVNALARTLDPYRYKEEGRKLAEKLNKKVPVIYASSENSAVAYNWKIKFNEGSKIPAFYNVFSELNHNEMTGFDVANSTKSLSDKFHFIFLSDENDHPCITKRMELTKQFYAARGFSVETMKMEEGSAWHSLFASLILADWTAYYCALQYDTEPERSPMIEEFKKLIV